MCCNAAEIFIVLFWYQLATATEEILALVKKESQSPFLLSCFLHSCSREMQGFSQDQRQQLREQNPTHALEKPKGVYASTATELKRS